jgi:hypothetical protein
MPHSSPKFTGLNFIHITPDPGLPRLIGADQRVLRFVEMFGGVLVLGRIATTYMSATQAQAQVNPGVASFDTVLAHMLVRLLDLDLVEVGTFLAHRSSGKKSPVFGQVTSVM